MEKKELTKTYFKYKSLDELKADVNKYNVDITFDSDLTHIKNKIKIGDRTAGNTLAIHPMEGCDGTLDGAPDELTVRRWLRFGVGGAKLIGAKLPPLFQRGELTQGSY